MAVERINGNLRSKEGRFCREWLRVTDELRERLYEEGDGFDPFRFNETATVGFLVAAAGRAGLYALPEFTEDCRKLPEGRVRAGRCDLWLANEDWTINWLLEFKLCWYGPRSRKGLVTQLNAASLKAFERDRREADDRWGCVVYCPADKWFELSEEEREAWASPANIERLSRSVDFAFKLSGAPGPAYVLLKKVPALARKPERCILDPDLLGS